MHLDALREWLRHTEEAAKSLDSGDYVKAEERLNAAIKEVRPYLPERAATWPAAIASWRGCSIIKNGTPRPSPSLDGPCSVRERDKNARPESVFECVYTLGLIQAAQKHHGEAEQLLKRSLAMQEKNLGRDHINSTIILNQLASLYVDQAKYANAEPLYARLVTIHERKAPEENLDLAETADKYAELLRLMNRSADADRWHTRARRFATPSSPRRPKPGLIRFERTFGDSSS